MVARLASAAAKTRQQLVVLMVGLSALAPLTAGAQTGQQGPIEVGEPEGFASLTARQTVLVDVYFGGRRIGEAQIHTEAGRVEILEPDIVTRLVPGLADPDAVQGVLSSTGGLPGNADLVCSIGSDPRSCGRIEPAIAAVIYDRENFRLHLFINPELLTVSERTARAYLPEPVSRFGLINRATAVISGSIAGGDDDYFHVGDRLLLSRGKARLIAEIGYSNDLGFEADQIMFQLDRREHRLLAGVFWSPGVDLLARQRILGVGVESQIDTRLDKEEIRANPIVVFLSQRSRVDIVRDGRIISSAVYDAGNQRLETAGLPDGSYEITLRITEAAGNSREETRFFQKSRRIPSLGRNDFFAFAGLEIHDPYALGASDDPFIQVGWSGRLNRRLALEATATLTAGEVVLQAGGTVLTPLASFRASLLGSSHDAIGGLVQIYSGGFSRLNFNAEFRHLEFGQERSALGTFNPATPGPALSLVQPLASVPNASLSQATATISYSLPRVQFFGSAFYRDETGGKAIYGIGPAIRWEIFQHDEFRVSLNGNAALTDRGETGFLGISIGFFGNRGTITADAGSRLSNVAMETSGFAGGIAGGWHDPDFHGAQLSLGAGYERDPDQDVWNVSTQIRGKPASISGDIIHSSRGNETQTQYSASAESMFAVGSGAFDLQSRTSNDSMLVARVRGARADDRFELFINDAPSGVIEGRAALTLPLPSYQAYRVRVRSLSAGLVSYDASDRQIGLYPGTVEIVEWQARPIRVILARLVLDDGSPVVGAAVTGEYGIAETDLNGHFQIETIGDGPLSVSLRNGASYRVDLPDFNEDTEWGFLGDIACCSQEPEELLAATGLGDGI